MKIRTKLAAAVLACLIPIWIGFAIITGVARSSDRDKTLALIEEYTASTVAGLQAFFEGAAELAGYLAELQAETGVEWAEGGARLFQSFIRRNPSVKDAGLVDENGFCYNTGVPGNPYQGMRMTANDLIPSAEPVILVGSEYWTTYIEGNRGETAAFVMEPYIPLGLNYKAIVTGAPVMRAGRCVGTANVMQTSLELSSLYSDLTERFIDRFGTGAQAYLISDGGQLVSSLKYSADFNSYRDDLFGRNDIISSSTLGAEALQAFDGAASSGQAAITARLDGASCFVSSARIKNTPFAFCIAVPQRYMLSSARTILVASSVIFVVITMLLLVIWRIATSVMLHSLKTMHGTMQEIASGSGDLTVRLEVNGNDEIADISGGFNQFISTLHGMVENVSTSASSMSKIGQVLSSNVSAISGDVSSINRDIDDMNFAVEEQGSSVSETSATVTQIARNIESLTSQIEDQSSAVTQSSASVQEMVANIGSISANISKAAESFDELRGNADGGKESISAVQDLVNALISQSDSLLEANSVIDNIASQTNLLAMNAAIEAAHAGDAGRGFSVVAEEIRKLAEDSAEQSRAIAAGLKSTISSIKSIASATAAADEAFDSVAVKIAAVTSLVSEINMAMHEQSNRSREVLDTLRDIDNITIQIRDGAVEMNSGAESVLKDITRLSGVSQSVQDRSASIAKSAGTISSAAAKIVQSSSLNQEAINLLLDITNKFKL